MKPLLRQFYNGELCPSDETHFYSKQHVAKRDVHDTHMDEFYHTLKDISPDLARRLETLGDERDDLCFLELEDTFCYGFRLGLTLLAEALYP